MNSDLVKYVQEVEAARIPDPKKNIVCKPYASLLEHERRVPLGLILDNLA